MRARDLDGQPAETREDPGRGPEAGSAVVYPALEAGENASCLEMPSAGAVVFRSLGTVSWRALWTAMSGKLYLTIHERSLRVSRDRLGLLRRLIRWQLLLDRRRRWRWDMLLLLLLLLLVLGLRRRETRTTLTRHYTAEEIPGSMPDGRGCRLRRWRAAMMGAAPRIQFPCEPCDFVLVPGGARE